MELKDALSEKELANLFTGSFSAVSIQVSSFEIGKSSCCFR
jgi:hypothetical protein|nr:hypothetical protein [Prevotella sp.]